jgi:hypothetical protein
MRPRQWSLVPGRTRQVHLSASRTEQGGAGFVVLKPDAAGKGISMKQDNLPVPFPEMEKTR